MLTWKKWLWFLLIAFIIESLIFTISYFNGITPQELQGKLFPFVLGPYLVELLKEKKKVD